MTNRTKSSTSGREDGAFKLHNLSEVIYLSRCLVVQGRIFCLEGSNKGQACRYLRYFGRADRHMPVEYHNMIREPEWMQSSPWKEARVGHLSHARPVGKCERRNLNFTPVENVVGHLFGERQPSKRMVDLTCVMAWIFANAETHGDEGEELQLPDVLDVVIPTCTSLQAFINVAREIVRSRQEYLTVIFGGEDRLTTEVVERLGEVHKDMVTRRLGASMSTQQTISCLTAVEYVNQDNTLRPTGRLDGEGSRAPSGEASIYLNKLGLMRCEGDSHVAVKLEDYEFGWNKKNLRTLGAQMLRSSPLQTIGSTVPSQLWTESTRQVTSAAVQQALNNDGRGFAIYSGQAELISSLPSYSVAQGLHEVADVRVEQANWVPNQSHQVEPRDDAYLGVQLRFMLKLRYEERTKAGPISTTTYRTRTFYKLLTSQNPKP